LPDELDTDEARRVIDQLNEAGLKQLLFVGGEPLVRPDLLELVRYASQSFIVAINTNAFSLDRTMAVELKEAGVSQVRISIDGADARTHDLLRRAGSFTRAIEAVKYSVQHLLIHLLLSERDSDLIC
jgi:MoaA/NifB/PqqE/SkfB family radical SAM enzyme